jgi:hypothetical protein
MYKKRIVLELLAGFGTRVAAQDTARAASGKETTMVCPNAVSPLATIRTGRIARNVLAPAILLALFGLFPLETKAADKVSITSINEKTGSITVRNDTTGHPVQFKITNAASLKSLRVGQVIPPPSSAQPNAMQRRPEGGIPIGIGPQSPNRCFEDCIAAPQTTVLQCMYWCATR